MRSETSVCLCKTSWSCHNDGFALEHVSASQVYLLKDSVSALLVAALLSIYRLTAAFKHSSSTIATCGMMLPRSDPACVFIDLLFS
jgi:hypothetical protein